MGTAGVIDSDQHLVEPRSLWADHIDPAHRADAVRMDDDDAGNTWLRWRDQTLGLALVQTPGDTGGIGQLRQRALAGEAPAAHYDDLLPRDHWDPAARVTALDGMGVEEAVCFPNYGLLWERRVGVDRPALLANMRAWNRWCASVVTDGHGRLHPVGHVSLRDLDWLDAELGALAAAGVRTAMVAPALVDGRPLSHPDLDRAWGTFATHGIAPCFHVADQPRPFDDAWYVDADRAFVPTLESVFLYSAAALALTDLIVNGVLERHPDLRIGVVELSAVWVPLYLMMLDGGVDFTTKLNGQPPAALSLRPSEYFLRQVRVSSFAYELPTNLRSQLGGADLLMCCSDYPHSEGTADPLGDYGRGQTYGLSPDDWPGLFAGNAAFLLGRS
ncbi:MAG: hypothetical protein FJW95_05480 [Actinobacteria bacterium]|nr:hypothetical protein [Actinomycetota bacterium]